MVRLAVLMRTTCDTSVTDRRRDRQTNDNSIHRTSVQFVMRYNKKHKHSAHHDRQHQQLYVYLVNNISALTPEMGADGLLVK